MKTPKRENPKNCWATNPASLPSTEAPLAIVDTVLSRETGRPDGSPVSYEIPVSAYPTSSGKLLANSPGSGEGRDSVQQFIAGRSAVYPEIFPDGDDPPNTLLVVDGLVREEFLVEIKAVGALP